MVHSAYTRGLAIALFGLFLMPAASWSQKKESARPVKDEINLFSKDALKDANAVITKIKEKHNKDLFIETIEKIPEDVKDYKAWAIERSHEAKVNGVYIVIALKPKKFEVIIGKETHEKGVFTTDNMNEIISMVRSKLGKTPDEALLAIANYTLKSMDENAKAKTDKGCSPFPSVNNCE